MATARFDSKDIRRIGMYTSGGDAPGMNAALRAATRMCLHRGLDVVGIRSGYNGMMSGDFTPLTRGSMANVIQRGGTILKTGRSAAFMKPEGRAEAARQLKNHGIDALVCIGGDGSFRGAHALWEEQRIPVVGVPGTIDNDIFGTDSTIGFDTAVNIALEAIDRIRDTAASHDRLFIVEVMGRDSGFIALDVGLGGGAEEIFTPENPVVIETVVDRIKASIAKGKLSSILVAAEGQKPGRAYDLAEAIRKKSGFDAKVCILGHIQRGGSPTAADRVLASRLSAFAVEKLIEGHCDCMAATQAGENALVPFEVTLAQKKPLRRELLKLANILAT